jgi:hypothetical protein
VDKDCNCEDAHMPASASERHQLTRSTDIEACMNLTGREVRDEEVDARKAQQRKASAIEEQA